MSARSEGERIARVEGAYEHLATKADLANLRTWMVIIVFGAGFAYEIVIPRLFGI